MTVRRPTRPARWLLAAAVLLLGVCAGTLVVVASALRTLGQWMAKVRRMAAEFHRDPLHVLARECRQMPTGRTPCDGKAPRIEPILPGLRAEETNRRFAVLDLSRKNRLLSHPAAPAAEWSPTKPLRFITGVGLILSSLSLVALAVLTIRAFTAGNIASLMLAMGRGGMQFMLIIWLQGIWLPLHGYDFSQTPLWAGIYLVPLTTGFLVAAPLSMVLVSVLLGRLSDRLPSRRGLIVAAHESPPISASIHKISRLKASGQSSAKRAKSSRTTASRCASLPGRPLRPAPGRRVPSHSRCQTGAPSS